MSSDMERSAAGTKRKLKENAFTAQAESGTLKVKIQRRDQKPGESFGVAASTFSTKNKPGRKKKQSLPPSDSPPKPRPNRKHVPIFYEPQFRQPIKRGGSHSSSTDESVAHSTSSTGVPGIHSTSSTDFAASSATSTSSSFMAQLSDVRLNSTSTSGGDVGPPPRMNPLFTRNDSDGLRTFGDLLVPYFPSPGELVHSFPLEGVQPRTKSSAGLLVDQPGLSSALHQLTSASASYRSALNALSTRESSTSAAEVSPTGTTVASSTASSTSDAKLTRESSTSAAEVPPTDTTVLNALSTRESSISAVDGAPADTTAVASSTVSSTSDAKPNRASGGLENYRFDPFSALQTAIDHARRSSSIDVSADGDNDKQREIGSPNSNARYYRLEPSGSSATTHNGGNPSATGSMGPPPELPPAFTAQNSLMGGSFISKKTPVEGGDSSNKSTESVSGDESPPAISPSFLLQNLLMGGISMSKLPTSHSSLDRLGSLTSFISHAKEATKDQHTSLGSPPKAHLSLDRLVSLTSVTSDDDETSKAGMKSTVSAPGATCNSASSSSTADGAHSKNVLELGPPPSGPPAFTIGNSLMGGGIDLQPAAAKVNTQDFDWKLHRGASSSGDVHSTPGGISHGLRARLERKLASSDKSEQLQDK